MALYHDRDSLERMCNDFNHPDVRIVDGYNKYDDIEAELLAEHLTELGAEISGGAAYIPDSYDEQE